MADEPPIMVGGGGSTYIWIKKGLALTPEPNPQPDYPLNEIDPPLNLALYDCYKVEIDLVRYKTHDGDNEGNFHKVKKRRKHCTRFYDSSK